MRAIAVIGAAFGDEGKGLMTDFFVRKCLTDGLEPIVVRFNGGAQAGHTVMTADGMRHVFHHYGAGTLAGAATFLSSHFVVNPILWREEYAQLSKMTMSPPVLIVHPSAPVTTYYDMMLNRAIEKSRGLKRHGSCGIGINETMLRNENPQFAFRVTDLSDNYTVINSVLGARTWARRRLIELDLYGDNQDWLLNDDVFYQNVDDCLEFRRYVFVQNTPCLMTSDAVVFEGAQGLLLDAENKEFFPHVTRSRTGLTNVIELSRAIGVRDLHAVYVTRSYLTRHGAGPLPGENPNLSYEDSTNVNNPWQGPLRFAPLNRSLLENAITNDLTSVKDKGIKISPSLAVTHLDQNYCLDQLRGFMTRSHEAYGPRASDVLEDPYFADHLRIRT